MPKYYIGSSSVERVLNGYRGSVRSKKYKPIWEAELLINPHMFTTLIISTHHTRAEALNSELIIQQSLKVVCNPDYINESYARVNGYCGRDVSGENNPMYGKHHSVESRAKISHNHADVSGENNPMYGKVGVKPMLGKTHSDDTRMRMSLNHADVSGENNPMYGKVGQLHPWHGQCHSEQSKIKMRKPKEVVTCPHCGKSGGKPPMVRFHFDNCSALLINPSGGPYHKKCPT